MDTNMNTWKGGNLGLKHSIIVVLSTSIFVSFRLSRKGCSFS